MPVSPARQAVASLIGRALPAIILKTVAACLTSLFKVGDTRLMAFDLIAFVPHLLLRLGRSARAFAVAWLHVLLLGAQILVLACAPASYRNGRASGRLILRHIYLAMAPLLTWFLVMLSTLVSLVLIRIVVATAVSYGLSQYALEVLVRTLVLELIPLYAAIFVALRYSMPGAQRLRDRLARRQERAPGADRQQLLQTELLPRALAGTFAVLLLAALNCVVALLLTYLAVYGFSRWGLPTYTRSVGQVFSAAVTLIFALKTLFFSLAVAIVPIAASARRDADGHYRRGSDLSGVFPPLRGAAVDRNRLAARQLLLDRHGHDRASATAATVRSCRRPPAGGQEPRAEGNAVAAADVPRCCSARAAYLHLCTRRVRGQRSSLILITDDSEGVGRGYEHDLRRFCHRPRRAHRSRR
jgi:phospholipid/cholesterol/gamma-HCH transport system permease protein